MTCPKSGDGSCQIVDANKQVAPDGTPDGGCGFVGKISPEDMYVDEDTSTCAFNLVNLSSAGCDFPGNGG